MVKTKVNKCKLMYADLRYIIVHMLYALHRNNQQIQKRYIIFTYFHVSYRATHLCTLSKQIVEYKCCIAYKQFV